MEHNLDVVELYLEEWVVVGILERRLAVDLLLDIPEVDLVLAAVAVVDTKAVGMTKTKERCTCTER
jgi:hypothetical protein